MTTATNSTESSLSDVRISQTIIEFALALRKRYNIYYAECMRNGRALDIEYGYHYDENNMDGDECNKIMDKAAKDQEYMREQAGVMG
ncbi:MAG: hypothetical protein ACRD8Z_05560, partial [Nitrososphaeraceae archaeon]